MFKIRNINPVARAIMVFGAVATLVTGVTMAALVDSASLTGNTVTTASATANLLLWDGDSFEPTAPGFNLTELEPGVESSPFNFYFKNDGNMDLFLTVEIPTEPTVDGLTLDDVTLEFTGPCADTPVTATIADLVANEVDLPCDPLNEDAQGVIGDEGNEGNYSVTVLVDGDVELGSNPKSVGSFSLVFNGYSTDEEAPVTE